MSAPDTNLEKQKKWHRGPLLGMAAAVGFALVLFIGWLVFLAEDGATPGTEPGTENGAVIAPVEGVAPSIAPSN